MAQSKHLQGSLKQVCLAKQKPEMANRGKIYYKAWVNIRQSTDMKASNKFMTSKKTHTT